MARPENVVITVAGTEYPGHIFPDAATLSPLADGYLLARLAVPVDGVNHTDPIPTRDTGRRHPETGQRVLELVPAWQAASVAGLPGVTHEGQGVYRVEADGRTVQLDLRRIRNPEGHHGACRAFIERDAGDFNFATHNNLYALGLVLDNWMALKSRGMLEKCIAEAWTASRTNNAGFPAVYVQDVLWACDRRKLQAAGDPMPAGDRFTLYRGVAGKHPHRRVHGMAWTDSLGCACWFAVRMPHLERPEVVTATVARDEVFFFASGRTEREYVTRPKSYRKLKLTPEEMQTRAKAWRDETK